VRAGEREVAPVCRCRHLSRLQEGNLHVVPVCDGHGGNESARLSDPAQKLSAFRLRLYGCFGRRADVLFELCDALLTAGSVPSPPRPAWRRR
jgi:hypothetical protein